MIITSAPFRVSFLGGRSDFSDHFVHHGGAVLGTAIRKYTFVQITPCDRKFHGSRFKFAYNKIELPDSIDAIQHPLIREAVRLVAAEVDIEMHTFAEVPSGTGLGSSSSFAVALLQALHAFKYRLAPTREIAEQAIWLEREILNEHGGHQDQIFAAYGGFNLIEFGPGNGFCVNRLPLSAARQAEIEAHCLLLYTNVRRNSFEVPVRQDVTPEQRTRVLSDMAQQARDGAVYLAGDKPIEGFGELLHEGWLLKQRVASVSMPLVDEVYERARELGAIGGKLLGAGQGGFLLLWARPRVQTEILNVFGEEMPTMRLEMNARGSTIVYNG